MVILGIDPGLRTTGYGAIQIQDGVFHVIETGYMKTSPGLDRARKLAELHQEFETLLDRTKPDLVSIENVFSLIRYPKAGIILGQVLGVLYLSVVQKKIAHLELSPKEIKNAIVGHGNAGKEQIKKAVMKMLGLQRLDSSHASDAIAAAIAGFYRIKTAL